MPREDSLVRVIPFTVPQGATIELDISGAVSVFFNQGVSLGTADGELAFAFGDSGDFMTVAQGDFIRCSPVRRLRIRNLNALAAKSGVVVVSADPNFVVQGSPGRAI